jgi:hypothetical protein
VQTGRGDDGRAHDPPGDGLAQQTGDARLGDVQSSGDLRLDHVLFVVEPGHLNQQPQVVDG